MRLVMNYRRSLRWWLSPLCAGVSVATAFAVLAISDAAPAFVKITTASPGTGPASPYDIIVSPPGAVTGAGCRCVTSPSDLSTLPGGITVAQYDKISGLPGTEVAAPMTMVGYVPLTVTLPIDVPAAAVPGAPDPVTLTMRLRSDNGLSSVTWDDATTAQPAGHGGPGPATVLAGVSWTFELPLVAVDPVAEARLLHLDAAVTSGSYLSAATAMPPGTVPVLMAGSIADGESANISFNVQSGASVGMFTLTAAAAYAQLLRAARENAATVRTYWTASPVTYGIAADGELVPRPVAVSLAAVWSGPYEWAGTPADAGVLDTAFRSLTPHTALGAGAAVRAVGVFDPARVTSTPAAPNPYAPPPVTGANARSRQLLGGLPLGLNDDPGDFANAAATLVMPLADIGALTTGYQGTNAAAPIGAIRVRVAGVTGDDPASQDRVRQVAQEIVRATGRGIGAGRAPGAHHPGHRARLLRQGERPGRGKGGPGHVCRHLRGRLQLQGNQQWPAATAGQWSSAPCDRHAGSVAQPGRRRPVVTLTAHVTPPSATGSLQFSVGGTGIGSPVTVSDGWAATTTSFTVAGTQALSAVFTPTGKFRGSTANLNLTVNAAPPNTGIIPLAVTVPAAGSFTLTVDTGDTITLTLNGNTAAAATTPIVVSDTRNTFPGWSISGQDTGRSGSGAAISGNQLGWKPASGSSPIPPGVTLGGPVAPDSPALGTTPAVLALVHAGLNNGYGTITLVANLTLAIPAQQAAARYTSGLSITSVSANP